MELSPAGSEAVCGHDDDLFKSGTFTCKILKGLIDRRLVLFQFCVCKKGFIVIAGEFLGRYANCIRFAPHRCGLSAKTPTGKVVSEQEDVIAMLSYDGSGDPLHSYDSISHGKFPSAKELPPEESSLQAADRPESNWISKLRPAGVQPVRFVPSALRLRLLPHRGGPTGTGTPAGRSPRPLAANRSDLPTG